MPKKTDDSKNGQPEGALTLLPGGATIESMAESGEVLDPTPASIKGTQTALNFSVVCEDLLVNRSSLKIKTPSVMRVEGQFQPGDEVAIVVLCRVKAVHMNPICDRFGNELGYERVHQASVRDWWTRASEKD